MAIKTQKLTKDYGEGHGLFDLDLEIRRGEILGFLGPNGAGKSTTMRLLLDLIKPTSGSATLLGLDSRADSLEIRRRVGFLPGDLALYPRLSGRAMLDYLAELRGGVDRRVRDALAERFDADLDRRIRELSTGNRQKLGLIQAFMHEPELLILDEPIAGLDPARPAELPRAASRGRRARDAPSFSPRTRSSEVERVADRVAILRRGRLVVVDSLESLRAGRRPAARDRVRWRPLPGSRARARCRASAKSALDGARLVVAFEGSADALVKAIAAYEVSVDPKPGRRPRGDLPSATTARARTT